MVSPKQKESQGTRRAQQQEEQKKWQEIPKEEKHRAQ
jgi:hypothetical protein